MAKESDLWYAGDQQGAGSKVPEVISDHNQKGTIPRKLPGLVNVYKKTMEHHHAMNGFKKKTKKITMFNSYFDRTRGYEI